MVLMALDHVRDFFHADALAFQPTDLSRTSAALFLTRWVTHFCAPVFVFLAGTGAFLSTTRGKTQRELARFLLVRGLWLVLLELTLVRFGWFFNFDYHLIMGLVIWALGWSLVALAGLVFLPHWAIAVFGVGMILLHNLGDGIRADQFGEWGWLWIVLHQGGPVQPMTGVTLAAAYPLVPWIGVMAAGYALGPLLLLDRPRRRRLLATLGLALTLAFVLLRATNLYGDPHPWSVQASGLVTLFSFLNCEKYPPSLLFLLMTLGPSIALLAVFDTAGEPGRCLRPLVTFGRVPLFYYLLHLPLIHALAVLSSYLQFGRADWWFQNNVLGPPSPIPAGCGYGLPVVYLVWIAVVVALYPACRWFAGVKERRRDVWLSFL